MKFDWIIDTDTWGPRVAPAAYELEMDFEPYCTDWLFPAFFDYFLYPCVSVATYSSSVLVHFSAQPLLLYIFLTFLLDKSFV